MNPTIQLRRIIEQPTQYEEGLSHKERIEIGRQHFFGDMDYPIFDEDYRKGFETRFIRHFFFKNIGFETAYYFKFELETWLQINMPYFNDLFESERLDYDPLSDTDVSITTKKTADETIDKTGKDTILTNDNLDKTRDVDDKSINDRTTDNDVTVDNFNRNLYLETPQDRLNITANDGEGVIESATSIVEDTDNNKETTTTTENNIQTYTSDVIENEKRLRDSVKDMVNKEIGNTIEDFIYHKTGKASGRTYAKMIQEYRSSLLRIEKQIFKECNHLFMQVYFPQ